MFLIESAAALLVIVIIVIVIVIKYHRLIPRLLHRGDGTLERVDRIPAIAREWGNARESCELLNLLACLGMRDNIKITK